MATAANVKQQDGSHFYYQDGRPAYEVPYADPRKGNRPTTLADAKKLNLLPSTTTILKILHKQALVEWLIEQAVLAVLTTPRLAGEADDAFVERVLHGEKIQDQESKIARDRGTEIHAALETLASGVPVAEDLMPWVQPAWDAIKDRGSVSAIETTVVGDGYAGKIDLIQERGDCVWLWDWKTAKKLPDPAKGGAWSEHRLQLASYAAAYSGKEQRPIKTGNVYISTVECGKFVVCEHGPWEPTYVQGFAPLVKHWQWATGYNPNIP